MLCSEFFFQLFILFIFDNRNIILFYRYWVIQMLMLWSGQTVWPIFMWWRVCYLHMLEGYLYNITGHWRLNQTNHKFKIRLIKWKGYRRFVGLRNSIFPPITIFYRCRRGAEYKTVNIFNFGCKCEEILNFDHFWLFPIYEKWNQLMWMTGPKSFVIISFHILYIL